ncbi:MAG: septal ring lytic transglycosylase RlpA family protein [Synergistaceae bacterium]|jgi:rare lipoprotein A|nr:septal ring lytic transglycosylase RlpA family protein [Synergistaceae bacterium]
MKQSAKRCAIVVAFILLAAFPRIAESVASVPSTYAKEGGHIVWKIAGTPIWKFPAEYAADVSLLSGRFNNLYNAGFKLKDMKVDKADGKWTLFIGKNSLYSINPAYSKSAKQDPQKMALQIMSRLYGVLGKKYAVKLTPSYQIRGKYDISASVSWYGGKFIGRSFANGEQFTDTHLSAAAKTLPFGTLVKVTAPSGKSVVVRVTDRFKEHKNRVLDISHAAADLLGIKEAGITSTRIEVIGRVDNIGGK